MSSNNMSVLNVVKGFVELIVDEAVVMHDFSAVAGSGFGNKEATENATAFKTRRLNGDINKISNCNSNNSNNNNIMISTSNNIRLL